MILSILDWYIISAYLIVILCIGIWTSRNIKTDTKSFFLAGRNMPWWLLGISMVATTFSRDTPNILTGLVRQKGVLMMVLGSFLVYGILLGIGQFIYGQYTLGF